jgi:hypothetical protein
MRLGIVAWVGWLAAPLALGCAATRTPAPAPPAAAPVASAPLSSARDLGVTMAQPPSEASTSMSPIRPPHPPSPLPAVPAPPPVWVAP